MQEFWWNKVEGDGEPVWAPCGHPDLWLAPDGVWRCEVCEPAHFQSEVRGRRLATSPVLNTLDEAA
jgi:hypothetical protein